MKSYIKVIFSIAALSAFHGSYAGDVYGGVGIPGVFLGYSQPVSPKWALRGEVSKLGSMTRDVTDNGIDYTFKGNLQQGAALVDFSPWAGAFHLTTGASFNDFTGTLHMQGNGAPITIGSTTVTGSSSDTLDMKVKFSPVTPYLGLGWKSGTAKEHGVQFGFDLGASVGSMTVTADASQSLKNKIALTGNDPDAEINAQVQKVRDGAAKVKFIPKLNLTVGYRF